MKSRTSFFNKGIFLNILKRTWPLWAVFFIICFLPLSFATLVERMDGLVKASELVPEYIEAFMYSVFFQSSAISAIIIAILAAMAAFSFLFTAKNTNLIASMPVSRTAVFGSAYLAGFVPVIASYFLTALTNLLASLGTSIEFPILLEANVFYFFINSAEFFIFYSIAVMIAMITANAIAMPVLYIIFNFLFAGMETVVRSIICEFSFGVAMGSTVLDPLSPFLEISAFNIMPITEFGEIKYFAWFYEWKLLIIYLVAALILSLAALLLFKKRRMESAGDVVAVLKLRPVFKFGVSVCASLCIGALFFVIFGDMYSGNAYRFFILLLGLFGGAFAGYFISEMLIRKSIHVFKGHWPGFIVICVLAAAFAVCCFFDLFGLSSKLPEADDIVSVAPEYSVTVITDKKDIEELLKINRAIIDKRTEYLPYMHGYYDESFSVGFRYILKDGSLICRYYQITSDENLEAYCNILNKPEYVLMNYAPDGRNLKMENIESANYELPSPDGIRGFELTAEQAYDYYYNALLPDIESGNIRCFYSEAYGYSDFIANVDISVISDDPDSEVHWYTINPTISPECKYSIQWFHDKLGVDLK